MVFDHQMLNASIQGRTRQWIIRMISIMGTDQEEVNNRSE